MAKLYFGMNQSLDGYVDHTRFAPSPGLFQHFIEQTRAVSGSIFGRALYELMAYWDEAQEGWGPAEHEFSKAMRDNHKWVVSSTLTSVGPNAELLGPDWVSDVRRIKAEVEGDVEVGGPQLAGKLTELDLIDEYRIYLHPVVLGDGTPFFAAERPRLRLTGSTRLDGDVMLLTYEPIR